MSLPIVAIRPEPGCSATVEAGRALGLDIGGHPLFEVGTREWAVPRPDEIDALLIGSANAIRYGGAGLTAFRGKPVYAVGEATADAARAAGFAIAGVGRGGLQSVLDRVPAPQRLLRLAGEDHVPLVPPDGVTIDTRIAYASEPLPMPADLAQRLRDGAVVLLHSAQAARYFASECERLGVPRGSVALAALGLRIAAAAGHGWRVCLSASEPTEAALLALADDLCHVSDGREGR